MNIKTRKGFTLTELIAVVVIMGILAAVGMGSYRKSLERAHMTEAYNVSSALLEGVNRYFYDNRTRSDKMCPKLSQLDVGAAKTTSCSPTDYCVSTQYFNITIPSGGTSGCTSGTSGVVTAASKNGGYSIVFYPDFSSVRSQDKCTFTGDKGKNFCIAGGYTACTTNYCCKNTYSGSICK